MTGFRGFSFLVCYCCCCFFSAVSTNELENSLEMARTAGYGEEKLSSVLVTGTLFCEACLDGEADLSRSRHVPGASVVVTCKNGGKRGKMNWAVGSTDEFGDFIVDLPSHLHANPRLDEACMVRVLQLPKSSACWRRVFLSMPKGIRLSSVGNGIRTYTTGIISLRSKSKRWRVCSKKARDLEEERLW